jgi:predicted O-methyltransferase YrrM
VAKRSQTEGMSRPRPLKRMADVTIMLAHFARHPRQLRYLPALARSLGKTPFQNRIPWLAFEAVSYLHSVVGEGTKVFEFGGGGSTLWLLDRHAEVTTVEHDPQWAKHLAAEISNPGFRLFAPDCTTDFSEYVDVIRGFTDDYFDVVVVDGRERVRCAGAAMAKVAPGGLLIVDDMDRQRYQAVRVLLGSWPSTEFVGISPGKRELGHTTVWQRPQDQETSR